MSNNLPELYLVAGMSGMGKTYFTCSQIDRKKAFFGIDPRGQLAEFFKVQPLRSRQAVVEALQKENFFILYQPGFEDFPVGDDWDFAFTLCTYMRNAQVIVDECDFDLRPQAYPSSFRKLCASARTQSIKLWVTAHRLKEIPNKLRALGKKVVFKLEEKDSLDFLRGLSGFNEEEIKNLPRFKYVILPKS